MRKRRVVTLAVGGVSILGLLAAGGLVASQNRYGPIMCTTCRLAYPMVDGHTKLFIETFVKKLTQPGLLGSPNFNVFNGDTIVVCNGSLCVDYVKSGTENWEGTSPREQVTPPRPGGGGSGGTGNPGGGRPPYTGPIGGGGGGGSGSVTVGQPQPQKPPTHEN